MRSSWSTPSACVRFRLVESRLGSCTPISRKRIKIVVVRLLGPGGFQDFEFSVQVEGLRTDYLRSEFDAVHAADELTEVDIPALRQYLAAAPQATTNRRGRRTGDPVNLVVVGDFPVVLAAFGARWNETEVISLATCWKTSGRFSRAPSTVTPQLADCFCSIVARTSLYSGFAARSTNACTCDYGPRRFNSSGRGYGLGKSAATSASASLGGPGI